MARAPITSRTQVIAEIQTIYKSQGVKEMKLLRHAQALDKAAKPKKNPRESKQLRSTLGRLVSDFFERSQFKPLSSKQKQQYRIREKTNEELGFSNLDNFYSHHSSEVL